MNLNAPQYTLLIAHDEPDIMEQMRPGLTSAGYGLIDAENGDQILEKVRQKKPDLVLLDLKAPGISELDVCKQLRSNTVTAEIPLIIVSSMKCEVDRIMALEIGVDDYVTKPFSTRELLLRIQAILRRSQREISTGNVKQIGGLMLDPFRYSVHYKGNPVRLTPIEFKLLDALIEHRGHLQSREVLFQNVWGGDPGLPKRTVDTHIQRLRQKLGEVGHWIETVRRKGYKMSETHQ